MRIAVIEHSEANDYAAYIHSLIEESARLNNYQVKTWSTSVPAFQQQIDKDAIIYINIESKSLVLLNWLYKTRIPSIIKKSRAEMVIDLNGVASPKIKIPQVIIAGEAFFADNKKHLNSIEKFAVKHFDRSVKIAKDILVYRKRNLDVHNLNKDKVQSIFFSAPAIFKSYEWHEKIMVKAQHADNKEYFIAAIEDNNVDDFVLLLQAFSKFKKWQQSSMQLLILAKYESLGKAIKEKHKTYKYREDVRLVEDIEEKQIAAIVASAYAFIHINVSKPDLLVVSVALQCSLPLISFANDDVREYAGDAVLFCAEKDANALGDVIIQIYKDENLHTQLKEKAAAQSVLLNRKAYEDKLLHLMVASAHI